MTESCATCGMKPFLKQIEIKEVELAYLRFVEHEDRFPDPDDDVSSEIKNNFLDKLEELNK